MMRILFCISRMPVGGREIFLLNLADALSRSNEKVGILVFKTIDKAIDVSHYVKTVNIFLTEGRGRFDFSFVHKTRRIMKSFRPDIIISFSDFAYFVIEGLQKLSREHIPHLIAFHAYQPLSLLDNFSTQVFLFFSQIWKAYYVFAAEVQKERFCQKYGLPRKRSCVIYNGVDTDFFLSSPKDKEGPFTIIHVANIRPEKDQWVLFKAVASMDEHFQKWRLIFIGDDKGNLLDDFKSFLKDKKILNKVFFAGKVGRDLIKEFLSSSDVFVLTSYIELFPIAALEAMAMGLPCIVTNVGGCPEIVKEGYNGFLIQSKDYKVIADKLLYLSSNRNVLQQMGRNARDLVMEKFSLERCSHAYWFLLRRIREDWNE